MKVLVDFCDTQISIADDLEPLCIQEGEQPAQEQNLEDPETKLLREKKWHQVLDDAEQARQQANHSLEEGNSVEEVTKRKTEEVLKYLEEEETKKQLSPDTKEK